MGAKIFGAESSTYQGILALEKKGLAISDLQEFSQQYGQLDEAKSIIERMVADDLPVSRFERNDMLARALAVEMFGPNPAVLERFLALCKSGLNPAQLREFPEKWLPTVEQIIADGANVSDLTGVRLWALCRIYSAFPSQPETITRLRELEKDGLNLSDVGLFVDDNSVHSQLLFELLNKGYRANELTSPKLSDLLALRSASVKLDLPSETANYLEKLQRTGLSGARLAEYMSESPERRAGVVKGLVANQADSSRLTDQMRLLVFPEDVASRLADKARIDGMSVAEILGNLRDWRFGKNFRDLVIKQVESDGTIAAADLRALALQARTTLVEPSERSPQSVEAELVPTEFGSNLGQTLKDTADRLKELVPEDKSVVLLGRDTWPLLPILRNRGMKAQYFLWSRLNGDDPQTYKQWLKRSATKCSGSR